MYQMQLLKKLQKLILFLISPEKNSYFLNEFSTKRIVSKEVLFCLNEVSKNSIFDFSYDLTKKFLDDFKALAG